MRKIKELAVVFIVIFIVIAGAWSITDRVVSDIAAKELIHEQGFEIVNCEWQDPNELETLTDPNYSILYDSADTAIFSFSQIETISVGDTEIYLKNMSLLNKDEVRDFALFMGAVKTNIGYYGNIVDEYYEGLLRLVPEKLLEEPYEN